MDGMINIWKEEDYTSHDVVAKLRGILKQKKIGHTGTLDPKAQGVLPVCLGKGTKLCDMLADRSKTYEAVLLLGVNTDTEDMTGEILAQHKVEVSEEEVRQAVLSFAGTYEQIPPMYSALKVNGKKLYELAREGKTIERKARTVTISEISIISIELPRVKFKVDCSKGTYIRSLCRDIGETLGCGGAMESLLRTRVGEFTLEQAVTLREVEQLVANGTIAEKIKPVDAAFAHLPKIIVPELLNKKVDNGNAFSSKEVEGKMIEGQCRVYKEDGMFIGIYQYHTKLRLYQPCKLFFVEGSKDAVLS